MSSNPADPTLDTWRGCKFVCIFVSDELNVAIAVLLWTRTDYLNLKYFRQTIYNVLTIIPAIKAP